MSSWMLFQRCSIMQNSHQLTKLEKCQTDLSKELKVVNMEIKELASHEFLFNYWKTECSHLDFPVAKKVKSVKVTSIEWNKR